MYQYVSICMNMCFPSYVGVKGNLSLLDLFLLYFFPGDLSKWTKMSGRKNWHPVIFPPSNCSAFSAAMSEIASSVTKERPGCGYFVKGGLGRWSPGVHEIFSRMVLKPLHHVLWSKCHVQRKRALFVAGCEVLENRTTLQKPTGLLRFRCQYR